MEWRNDAAKQAALIERDRLRREARERDRAEQARLCELRSGCAPPEACGFDAPHAPARGPVVAIPLDVVVEDGQGRVIHQETGYRGRAALRAQDSLDRIRGLTEAQRAAGRRYAALVEAVEAGGMKCSGGFMQDGTSGGDDGRCFMDAYIDDCDRLRRMNRAIGDGIGMKVRRVRPSARGTRASIPDRALAERICIGGQSLSEVLRAFGWAEKQETRKALSDALAAVLERLRPI
ncbi:hypothetical protein [Mangrovicoccus algicola]|uniref:Uncharacterized protein n=1 Tax=Mangrovicoccus algicola TaxID=2771008 RepID=A0A8J6YTX9_9RHOB|nr:hypothetical protein [Mangrovicoccus algicola]MBE3637477.1 hypothetical protein [Mangrovicoccus algicola]